ncbi:amino acid permease [Austwickia chelonae]|uniref:amino acid permease n=1 Tax=Austwickia chelonae TaxID=100225 RepID=UPI0019670054|nr:amino acid permease [Austwickia chelonae]
MKPVSSDSGALPQNTRQPAEGDDRAYDRATTQTGTSDGNPSSVQSGGLHRTLKNRHIQMIALGGAIGTGLFYGSSASIKMAGPAIILAYLVGGLMIFLIMRALGEMSVQNPVSGAFAHYAHENVGPFAGFFSGWNYWFNYVTVSMAELAVVGIYVNFWFPDIPKWVSSAVFLVLITAINLVSVSAYGEFEFWFALIKVVAIIAMILFGLAMILFGLGNGGDPVGLSNLTEHGGFFPHGWWGVTTALVIVMFSFGGVELIGITAGEAADPARSIPKAINEVVLRIFVFYVGAIFVILCIFPWERVGDEGSPFVTVFAKIGIPAAASLLNMVVLTAAVSAYNSGLYSNGRMLLSLAKQGNAPSFLQRVSAQGSPYAGILVSSAVTGIAVLLTYLLPGKVFLYLISVALTAANLNWILIVFTQLKFRQRIGVEEAGKLKFPMPLHPFSNYLVLAFLGLVTVLMWFLPDFRYALYVAPIWVGTLSLGYVLKCRAEKRRGMTPVP